MHCKYGSRLPIFLEIRVGTVVVALKLLCLEVLSTSDNEESFHVVLFLSQTIELAAKTP